MHLQRNDEGHWSIEELTSEDADLMHVWVEALPRYLDILDALFLRAQENREFDFIHSLIPVRGMVDPGWDAWSTSREALVAMTPLINDTPNWITRRHLKLWAWGHTIEAAEPYELLRNLVEAASGGRFHIEWFPDARTADGRMRPQHPLDKINQIESAAAKIGLRSVAGPLREIWDTDLRNAVFHADYALYGAEVRMPKVGRTLDHETVEQIVARAAAYVEAVIVLHDHYVSEYSEPKLISAEGMGDAGEMAWVIVREGHGAVGLKHALTADELAAGGIRWRLGFFTPEEVAMLDADPMLATLPAWTTAASPEP
jgi:hypothetical protein